MYVCMYVCLYVCMFAFSCKYTYIYIYMCVCVIPLHFHGKAGFELQAAKAGECGLTVGFFRSVGSLAFEEVRGLDL